MQGDVIDSLLVRLGLETDAQDFREAQSMFDGVRRSALQFGAVIGAGLGVQNLTFGFAKAKAELGAFADVYGVTAQFVDSLGYAFTQVEGNAGDAFSSIQRIRDLMEATEWGELPSDAFRVAGFDPMMLQGVTSVAEAYERIAAATQGLSPEASRRALSSLGFGDAEIRLLRQGPEGFRQMLAEGQSYARVTKEMTEQAIRFRAALTNMSKSVEGVSNELSTLILDDFSETMQAAADFLRENRSEIAGFFADALPWLEKTAVGIATLVALQGGKRALGYLGAAAGSLPIVAAGMIVATAIDKYGELDQHNDIGELGQSGGLDALNILSGAPVPMPSMSEPSVHTENDIIGGLGWPVPSPPPPVPLPPPPAPSIHTENHITVDARGASDPAAVEAAGQRGVEKALQRAAESAVNDLRTPVR